MPKTMLEFPLLHIETMDDAQCPACEVRDWDQHTMRGDQGGRVLYLCNACGCIFTVDQDHLVSRTQMVRLLNMYGEALENHNTLHNELRSSLDQLRRECIHGASSEKWSDSKLLAHLRLLQGALLVAGVYTLEALDEQVCNFDTWRQGRSVLPVGEV